MNELERRAIATKQTLAEFNGRPFDWSKSATCAHLLRYHGRAMGRNMPTVPRFRTALSAKTALKSIGFDNMTQLLDSLFPRIPPLSMLVGDVMTAPSDDAFNGVLIRADQKNFIGWSEFADGCTLVEADLSQAIGAWRI